eukprot:SAG11_NODE_7606_length_1122_cov_0.856305_2_plen_291_part_01
MQFAQQGLWGRGLYFAEKSSYSDDYSYGPSLPLPGLAPPRLAPGPVPGPLPGQERGAANDDEREMFLAKLLVGNAVTMDRDASDAAEQECRDLVVPPDDPSTGTKYNTVTGYTGSDSRRSQVWIVYENGRAYPDYLIRYYRGPWDQRRTPFGARPLIRPLPPLPPLRPLPPGWSQLLDQESGVEYYTNSLTGVSQWQHPTSPSPVATQSSSIEHYNPLLPGDFHDGALDYVEELWQFDDDGTWCFYEPAAQVLLEQTFQQGRSGHMPIVNVKTATWTYAVDLNTLTQTNIG